LGPIAWPPLEIDIPTLSPAAVASPAFSTWESRARAHRAALDASSADLGGVRMGALRPSARAEVLGLAGRYTRSLGLDPARRASNLVLCTGHQPILVHPGIWVKYLALARSVPADGIGVNFIVDNDAIDEIAAEVPRGDGRLQRARVLLARGGPDVPAEAIPGPDTDTWRAFVAEVDGHLASLGAPAVSEGWARARTMPPPPAAAGIAGAVTAARRWLEGPKPYLDLPVSWLGQAPAFRRFTLAILDGAARFAEVHNACLDDYREHYGVRTGAQPFPNLEREGAQVEVPFWYVRGGRRWPLWVDTRSGRLRAAGVDVGPMPGDPDDPGFAAAPIRPRALTLTAFTRLLVGDLFVHGIGGARYDRATDAVVRAFFGVEPPGYATATATLFLPFPAGGPRLAERQRLQRLLLDLQHNPDRFLSGDGAHRALVEEKWTLIRRLDRAAELTRRERRAATQRIREVNTVLQVAVADRVADVQEALRHLDRHDEDADVTAYRGYPFVLFPIDAIEALVDQLVTGHGPADGTLTR
jgi:hypothetical protein